MLVFLVVHLLAGILLGSFFRLAVMIPVIAVVVVESFAGASWLQFAPWYLLIVLGAVAGAMRLCPCSDTASDAAPRIALGARTARCLHLRPEITPR
jgi:hypothetical protein